MGGKASGTNLRPPTGSECNNDIQSSSLNPKLKGQWPLDASAEAHDYQIQGNNLLTLRSYSGYSLEYVARRILSSGSILRKKTPMSNNNTKALTSPRTRINPTANIINPK
jgi:hypothetical protein